MISHRCCICERLDRIEIDYMSEIQCQVTRNNNVKSDFIKRGVCNYHFWMFASLTNAEAVAAMGAMLIEIDNYAHNSCLICEHLEMKQV